MQHQTEYRLARSKTGFYEIRWTEHDGTRARSRSHSTRSRDRHEAEAYRRHWVRAKMDAELATRGPATVGDLLSRYLAAAQSRDVGPTQHIVMKHLVGYFGQLMPTQIDDETVRGYCAARGVSSGTLRRELNALVAALNYGKRRRLVAPEDVPHIELPPEGARRELYLNDEQEAAFVAALPPAPGPLRTFCLLALRTGARKSAIEKLTWDRVDFPGLYVDYRDPDVRRTKKRRVPVPIDDVLLPELEAARAASQGPLVVGRGGVRARFDRFREQNPQFEWVTPHVLRHTAATRWLRQGLSIWNVAGLLGDTVETTVRVYGHHATGDLRAAMGAPASAG